MSEIKNQNKEWRNTKNEAKEERRKDLKFLCYGIPTVLIGNYF
jgi:hypothetical protein